MATQIHGAGPAGQRSPGLDLAIAGYLAENPPAGGGGSGVTATDAPTAPAEGASASYLVTSAVTWPAGLVWSTDPDGGTEPTITTTALVSLFTVDGTTYAVMGSTYPAPSAPDETGPTAGTLGVVLTSTTADGTVTGAADETELHATPYSFRIDAGTWSAWQAAATYEWTGLTASTEYDFQHRVRDAAGNITEGTVVTDTTDAPSADTTDPTPGTLAASAITSESFTLTVTGASDETALHAQPYRFSTDNGATYSTWQTSAVFNATELDAETEYDCVHQVRDAAANVATGTAIEVTTSAASGGDTWTESFADGSGVGEPSGWSKRFNSATNGTYVEQAGYLAVDKTAQGRSAYTLDALDGVTGDVDVLVKARYLSLAGTGGFYPGIFVGGSGALSSEDGIAVMPEQATVNKLRVYQYDTGTATSIYQGAGTLPGASAWYWLRVHYNTATGSLSVRVWVDGDSEPGTWNTTMTAAAKVGWVGIWDNTPVDYEVDFFAAALGGSAPTS